jgi:hypothetical protein
MERRIEMNNNSVDHGWQQLQARIDQLLGKYLGEELHKIEFKPRDVIYLLEMPPDYEKQYQDTK